MRRRRQEVSVELRKARKDDQLLKRRNLDTEDDSALAQQEKSRSPASMTIAEIVEGMLTKFFYKLESVEIALGIQPQLFSLYLTVHFNKFVILVSCIFHSGPTCYSGKAISCLLLAFKSVFTTTKKFTLVV
jgi:Karyopherin (importin) alpha